MATTGYSGTPLAKKLGIKDGFKIRLVNAPAGYLNLFGSVPANVAFLTGKKSKKDLIHYFTGEEKELRQDICSLRDEIKEDGMIWISWPKKASKMPTNITEDIIRKIALNNGLVDIKVCAVDEVWSGLKLVIPKNLRSKMLDL